MKNSIKNVQFNQQPSEKNKKTYVLPSQMSAANGTQLPGYLGLGIINPASIKETDNVGVTAQYYEQSEGVLSEHLVYEISVEKEKATVHRYLDGEIYKVSTEINLPLAFFKSFDIKDKKHLTEDKPMFRFAEEVMKMGVHTFLYSLRYFYFPAGPMVRLMKPLLNASDEIAWLKFRDNYNNSTDDKTILKYDHSPFSSIEKNGTAVVFPVFLKDAIGLLKKENLLGSDKESAVQVFYT